MGKSTTISLAIAAKATRSHTKTPKATLALEPEQRSRKAGIAAASINVMRIVMFNKVTHRFMVLVWVGLVVEPCNQGF